MTTQCPYCKSEITEDNPVLAIQTLRNWISTHIGWDAFESDHSYPVGKVFSIAGKPAKVVAKKTTYDTGDIDRDGYYGSELPQGTIFETYIVIEYAGNFFKKLGEGDSYGEVAWNGELLPVTPKVKTVEVYEFNG
jgi:hypothetical protein